jgi:serine/threonine protein kinase
MTLKTCVGQYTITKRLGKGTYGQCFEAANREGHSVALKRIQYDSVNEYLHLFFREISILKSLSHPGIVKILDVVIPVHDDQQIYIVMELMTSDLRAYVKQNYEDRRVPLDSLQIIFSQIVSAVAFCHANNVWHRDLKPHNILIDWETLQIKIADFGLAKNINNRIVSSKVPLTHEIVTLWYRAPEVILGCSTYTSAIDVYSLGTVLYELCAGKPMFQGKSEVGTLMEIFALLGTPTESSCPGCSKWPHFSNKFPTWSSETATERIACKLPQSSASLARLIESMVRIDYRTRVTCKELLQDPWIQTTVN